MWKEVRECWICAKYSFYAVFYSKSLRDLYFHEFNQNDPNLKYISNALIKTNRNLLFPQDDEETIPMEGPYIAGTFNSWKLTKMYTLQEAWKILDKSKTIEVPESLSKPEYKRNKREQKLVETYLEQLDIRYRKSWNKIFEDNLLYKPFYENYPYNYSQSEDFYVYFGYFKPMKHDYVVIEPEENCRRIYYNSMVSLIRDSEIRVVNKEYNRNIVQREFK